MSNQINQNQTQNLNIQRQQQNQGTDESSTLQKQTGAGVINSANTFSYYQPAVQPGAGDSRIMPLAQPASGAVDNLGTMNINDIMAQLNGLKAESDEQIAEVQNQSIQANREKQSTENEKRIGELVDQLDGGNSEKNDKCAVAKIVLGALLGPAGIGLMVSGIMDKKAVDATKSANNEMLQNHFGPGSEAISEFGKEYEKDKAKEALVGQPIDQAKHQAQLQELYDKGVISPELHADLSQMVAQGAHPDAIDKRILTDAVAAYVDGSMPPLEEVDSLNERIQSLGDGRESVGSSMTEAYGEPEDFQKVMAHLLRMAEEDKQMEEVLRNIQEQLEGGQMTVLSTAENKHTQLGQLQSPI